MQSQPEGGIDVKPLMREVPKSFVHQMKPPADTAEALFACRRHERGWDFAASFKAWRWAGIQ